MEARELEALLSKVGGKFKLVTLFQKRMRELQRGLPRLIDEDPGNAWEIVAREIMSNKVDLLMGDEADRMRKDLAAREADETADSEKRKAKIPPKPVEPAEAPAPGPTPTV